MSGVKEGKNQLLDRMLRSAVITWVRQSSHGVLPNADQLQIMTGAKICHSYQS